MGLIALYFAVLAALTAQRASVIPIEQDTRAYAVGIPGSLLSAGAVSLVLGWALS